MSGYGYDPIEIPETRCYETEDDMMDRMHRRDERHLAGAEAIGMLSCLVAWELLPPKHMSQARAIVERYNAAKEVRT